MMNSMPRKNGGNAANALRDHKGIVVQGHGTFARGATVDEAFVILSSIEHACTVKYLVDSAKRINV
ncbi:MAG: hypothetical protein GH149_01890 [Methanosarcinales archaeon]|nr:hypothetical protein [Methanosarcinales archaeon]